MGRQIYIPKSHAPNMLPKGRQSALLADQVAEFLARGGTITQHEMGESAIPDMGAKGYSKQQRKKAVADGLRATSYKRQLQRLYRIAKQGELTGA